MIDVRPKAVMAGELAEVAVLAMISVLEPGARQCFEHLPLNQTRAEAEDVDRFYSARLRLDPLDSRGTQVLGARYRFGTPPAGIVAADNRQLMGQKASQNIRPECLVCVEPENVIGTPFQR